LGLEEGRGKGNKSVKTLFLKGKKQKQGKRNNRLEFDKSSYLGEQRVSGRGERMLENSCAEATGRQLGVKR